jgi:hypothetical protein
MLFIAVYLVLLATFFYFAIRIVLAGPEIPNPEHEPHAVRPGRDSAFVRTPAE